MAEGTKTCSRCGADKPLEHFHRNGSDGRYRPECRVCRAEGRGSGWQLAVRELELQGFRRCTRCDTMKPLAEFYVRRDRGGPMSACKDCNRRLGTEWREQNRDKYRAKMKRGHLKHSHGLTLEQFDALLEAQDGCCAICGTAEPGGHGRFHVDHDHACCSGSRSCGKCIRGLLCNRCNTGLGMFLDRPDRLRAAATYLDTWRR